MKTEILERFQQSPEGQQANEILRNCVHCGFCNATCPTYQLLGDELDGPRGRIYQIKQLFEGQPVNHLTRTHLDRCLTCRACETTCPSGVEYGRLADIGKKVLDEEQPRPWEERVFRKALRMVLPYRRRFGFFLAIGRLLRPLLPVALKQKVPQAREVGTQPTGQHERRMLVLDGCVQQAATPNSNAAAARVLSRLGVQLLAMPGCCGAASYHLSAHDEGLDFARKNIDAWWPEIEAGVEAIVSTASGCGVMVKDYGELLAHDPEYAEKARKVSELTQDIAEVLASLDLSALAENGRGRKVAFHPPCTLQHGQKINGVVEGILQRIGFELTPVADTHLCCGSAGTYSILQPELSTQLRDNKLANLLQETPEMILTSNVGCELHLETASQVPVRHWITVLDEAS